MTTTVLSPDNAGIRTASQALSEGFLVSVPSETVYGLAANALNEQACRNIFAIKGRPLIDPLIVHVLDLAAAQQYADIPASALPLLQHFWPGPLTIVVPKKEAISDLITAGLPTVALRVPAQTTFRSLLAHCQIPLAAPSANPFGYLSPTQASHVQQTLGEKIPYILDDGPCQHGLESTIIDLSQADQIRILRPGPITQADLQHHSGGPILSSPSQTHDQEAQVAPGNLSQHYSPHTRLQLFDHQPSNPQAEDAVIWLHKPENTSPHAAAHTFWLSETPNLAQSAQALFALLYRLDQQQFPNIHLQRAPSSEALADTYNDRVQRAAAKF